MEDELSNDLNKMKLTNLKVAETIKPWNKIIVNVKRFKFVVVMS